ncbi:MAG TPA: non-ribosomal peptide synthetase [Streptosporangiaceae bacterium]
MSELSLTAAIEDVGVDLPVDMPAGPVGPAPRRPSYIAVEVPYRGGNQRPSHWWAALFIAFLHRCTAAERIHLAGAATADGGVVLHSFNVAGSDTIGALTARVDASLQKSDGTTFLVESSQATTGADWSPRVLAGLPAARPAGDGGADIRLALPDDQVILQASGAMWTRQSVQRMAEHIATMASSANDDTPIAELAMLTPAERARMLVDWNNTAMDWPRTDYIELLRTHVRSKPQAPAVVQAGRTVTFAGLEADSNRIARKLASLGARRGERVGLLCPRSAEYIVAVIGILKTGAAVVPLDPVNPDHRLTHMIADSAPLAVLTTGALRDRVAGQEPRLVIDGDDFAGEPAEPVAVELPGDTISHLIYTSGSTGEPKAVLERHAAIVNLAHWIERAYEIRPGDRASWVSTPGFALQIMEWMPYLALGVPIHVGDAATVNDAPERLRDWLVAEGITHTMLVAALAERVWAVDWPAGAPLRIMCTTAERVHSWPPADRPFRVVMTYGATETTNVTSCLDIGAGFDLTTAATPRELRAVRPVPVGRPIANVRVYLLDTAGEPVPVGVVGRVHVAGAGLAAGYHQRPELTASKFAVSALPEDLGTVWYDTGDLARFRADGALELLGRSDSQVKVRGFRVEIGEVESTVCAAPGVDEGVVVTQEPFPGDVRLVAYVAGRRTPAPAAVRSYVAERLPHYMVPGVVVALEKLPRLPNGKVDRRSLPAPDQSIRDGLSTAFVAAQDPVEKEIARVWSELLRAGDVGSLDNFFELGGHSVLAVRMLRTISAAFEVELRLPDLCEHPTVASLAHLVATTRTATAADGQADRPGAP